MKLTATDVCLALRDDRSPESGWMKDGLTGREEKPRRAIWLADAQLWVWTSGNRSDREWELIATGDTPLLAVLAARAFLSSLENPPQDQNKEPVS